MQARAPGQLEHRGASQENNEKIVISENLWRRNSSAARVEVFQYKPPKCPCVQQQQQQLHGVDGKQFYVPVKAGLLQTNWVCIYIYKNKKQREDSESCARFLIQRNVLI